MSPEFSFFHLFKGANTMSIQVCTIASYGILKKLSSYYKSPGAEE